MVSGSPRRSRFVFVALAVAVLVLGVLSRTIQTNSVLFDKYLGDALYAVVFYVCLGAVFPRQAVRWRTLAIVVFVIAVECFQLTGIPLRLRQGNTISKLVSIVLGTHFSWYDVLAYFVGIACIVLVDVLLLKAPMR